MKEQNNIEEVFKKAFDGFEADPGMNAWTSIQSNVHGGTTTATVASKASISIITKTIIGVAIGTATVTGYFLINNNDTDASDNKPTVEESFIKNETSSIVISPSTDKNSETNVDAFAEDEISEEPAEAKIKINTSKELLEESSSTENSSAIDQIIDTIKNTANNIFNSESDNISDPSSTIAQTEKEVMSNDEAPKIIETNNELDATSSAIEESPVQENESSITPSTNLSEKIDENKTVSIKVPNIFTPNLDGENDFFKLNPEELEELNVDVISTSIFSLSGKLIHQQENNSSILWDGNLNNGEQAPAGQYYYLISVTIEGEKQLPQKGGLTLRR